MSDEEDEVRAFINKVVSKKPREERYAEETEEIVKYIKNRGDLRVGQAIINAVMSSERYEKYELEMENECLALHECLFNMEAPELLKAFESVSD